MVAVIGYSGLTVLGSPLALPAALVFVAASLVWLPVTRRWNARAHAAWASSVFLFLAYLLYVLLWTFDSGLGFWGTAGGLLL